MRTDDLILSLGNDARPVSPLAVEGRVIAGIGVGAAVTLALIAALLGFRPDLGRAILGFSFWMKGGYTIAIAACAIGATIHLSRPEADRPRWLWLLAVPVAVVLALAAGELIRTPTDQWWPLLRGQSWSKCSVLVAMMAAPIFAGLIRSFRRLAPTRLRLTGGIAGLASGATSATLYGLHCPEATATFVIVWYSLGMAAAAGIGALMAPRVLRW